MVINVHNLKNPPIVEAQITLIFNSSNLVDEGSIKNFLLKTQYSDIKPLMRSSFKIEEGIAKAEHSILGHRAEHSNNVIQCTFNNFAFSEINIYSNWNNVRNNTKILWNAFIKEFSISNVAQLSVRYINRLELPCAIERASEYWKAANPAIDSHFGILNEYYSRSGYSFPRSEVKGLQIQMLDNKPAASGHINLLVDILTLIHLDVKPDSLELWDKLDELRNFKNQIFFGNLTDKALELYK